MKRILIETLFAALAIAYFAIAWALIADGLRGVLS